MEKVFIRLDNFTFFMIRYVILWNFKTIKGRSNYLSLQSLAQQTDTGWAPIKWQAPKT